MVPDFPKPGIQFRDITPVLLNPALVEESVVEMTRFFRLFNPTKIIGIESRGFLLGPMLAMHLGAGFVIVRKEGRLPYQTHQTTYDLEYGTATIEMHVDAISADDRVVIHDDLLATGGTAAAAAKLVTQLGAEVVGFSFLVELKGLQGRQKLSGKAEQIHSLVTYP